jgi:hypothetical protein
MITFEKKYFSIVFLGNQNPSILNHDFLLRNNVLPLDVHPFSGLDFKNLAHPPFNEAISTPVVSRLVYSNISIVVEESRLQLTDTSATQPGKSPIINIAKNYLSVLKHTPLMFGGLNLNGVINLNTAEEKKFLESKLCVAGSNLMKVVGSDALDFGVNFSYKYKYGLATITMARIKDNPLSKILGFNFEFPFDEMTNFLAHLDDATSLDEHFGSFVKWMIDENQK